MPPRGKGRAFGPNTRQGSSAVTQKRKKGVKANEPSRWSWVDDAIPAVEQVNEINCLQACGFTESSGKPICKNKYGMMYEKEKPAEGAEDVIDLTSECSRKGCKDNPNCLNYLGQDKWEDEDAAKKAFLKAANLGPNPVSLARDSDTPVGLKNLGATCYANAFIQVWFQDLAFRSGVYSCRPSIALPAPVEVNVDGGDASTSTSEENLPPITELSKFRDAPLFQLQVTFAALQQCRQTVFNPTKLVESLGLRTTEQQDAQEFSKLFMSLLATEFEKQDVPAVKTLMADQFEGKLTYGTLCKGCGQASEHDSGFLELELNLTEKCKLEQRIEALLKKEELTEDNQYHCSRCEKLQDATRYTKLKRLPPVLHFSILRFVFDYVNMTRKKSKQAIRFPVVLDMGRFVEGGREGEEIYELRGVLLHKGVSAYHGHYEAQVFDVTRGRWYQFNDESVTPIDSLMDGKAEVDEKEEKKKDKKPEKKTLKSEFVAREMERLTSIGKRKMPPGLAALARDDTHSKRARPEHGADSAFDRNDKIEVVELSSDEEDDKDGPLTRPANDKQAAEGGGDSRYITSKDAYMLIYARRDASAKGPAGVTKPTEVPEPPVPQGLESDVKVPSPPATAVEAVNQLNEEHEQACAEHGKRELAAIEAFEKVRQIKRDIYQIWNIQDHAEESIAVNSEELERWLSQGLVALPKLPAPPRSTPQDTAGSPQEVDSRPTEDMAGVDIDGEHGHSDADSAQTLVSSPPPLEDPIRSHVQGQLITYSLCEHELLYPPAENVKRISKAAHQLLVDWGVEIKPALAHTQVCLPCTEGKLSEMLYFTNHPKHVDRFNDLNSESEFEGFWLSKAWLRDWKLQKPKMHHYGQADPAPDSTMWKDDVFCEHGGLKVGFKERVKITPQAHAFLKTLFPDWLTFSTNELDCYECEQLDSLSAEDRERIRLLADKEKAKLKTMWSPNPLVGAPPELVEGFGYAIMPANFMREWRRWINDPVKNARPESLDTTEFFCRHQQLLIDPNEPADLHDSSIVLVKEAEWYLLAGLYAAGPHIEIQSVYGEDRNVVKSNLEVCQECRRERKSSFAQTEIIIHVLDDNDALPLGKAASVGPSPSKDEEPPRSSPPSSQVLRSSPAKASDRSDPPQAKLSAYGYGAAGVRKSKRLRQPKQRGVKRPLIIAKDDTVKDLKVKLYDDLSIPTIYQRLFYNGEELLDNKSTVAELGILSQEVVQLLEIKPNADGQYSEDESGPPKKKKREEGRAFGGTLLGGVGLPVASSAPVELAAREKSAAPQAGPSDAMDIVEDTVACPACTFLNPEGVSSCTMCDEPFPFA